MKAGMAGEAKTRPWFVAIGGGVIVLLAAVLVGQLGGDGEEVATSAPAPASAPVTAPAFAPPPSPAPQGLVLHGIVGTGAIFAFPDGSQRLVPVGREVQPGVTLQALEPNAVVLRGPGGDYRLGFSAPDERAGVPAARPSPSVSGGAIGAR
jgi:hypothetical protein